jgi:hypothetical protein
MNTGGYGIFYILEDLNITKKYHGDLKSGDGVSGAIGGFYFLEYVPGICIKVWF